MSVSSTKPPIKLGEIASLIAAELHGSKETLIHGLCSIDDPDPRCITFSRESSVSALNQTLPKLVGKVGAVLVSSSLKNLEIPAKLPVLKLPKPQEALIKLTPLFFTPAQVEPGINKLADLHPTAKLGKNVSIGAFCSVGAGVQIGDDVVLYPHVTLYPGVKIGSNSIIHSGVVIREECEIGRFNHIQNGAIIGADGFGYIPDAELGLKVVPQIGKVVLGDYVEVGANSCIDRATLGKTTIGKGSKLDNLVQIGHNTNMGEYCIICGQSGIAGSAIIGNKVVLGGNSGVSGHIFISSGVRLAAKSAAVKDINEPGDYAGYPAIPAGLWRRQIASLNRLAKIPTSLKQLLSKKTHDE